MYKTSALKNKNIAGGKKTEINAEVYYVLGLEE